MLPRLCLAQVMRTEVWQERPFLCQSCGTISHRVKGTRGVNEYGLVIREMLALDDSQAHF